MRSIAAATHRSCTWELKCPETARMSVCACYTGPDRREAFHGRYDSPFTPRKRRTGINRVREV